MRVSRLLQGRSETKGNLLQTGIEKTVCSQFQLRLLLLLERFDMLILLSLEPCVLRQFLLENKKAKFLLKQLDIV